MPDAREFLPHMDLYSSWNFIKILKNGKVLGIKNIVVRVAHQLDSEGRPMQHPDGSDVLLVDGTQVIREFTTEEYMKIMQASQN